MIVQACHQHFAVILPHQSWMGTDSAGHHKFTVLVQICSTAHAVLCCRVSFVCSVSAGCVLVYRVCIVCRVCIVW